MNKLFKNIVLVLLLVLSVFTFTACEIDLPTDLSEEEIVINVLNGIEINYAEGETIATVSKDLQLPSSSIDGCTITWKSSDEAVISTDGKVTQADVDKQVKLTVKVTLNEVEFEKSFKITVLAKKTTDDPVNPPVEGLTSIAEILALSIEEGATTTETYKVQGKITQIQNAIYGQVKITDGTNEVLVYGIFDADGNKYSELTDKPVVGDTIVVEGAIKKFSGVNEVSSSTLISFTKGTNPVQPTDDTTTIATVLALNVEEGTTTTEQYTVKGKITEVQGAQYGNVVIQDSTGSILVYGMYDTNGNRYDAFEYKPVVGDTITVTSSVKCYSGALELINATLIKVEKAGTDVPIAEDEIKATIAEVLALTVADGASTEKKYVVSGTITEVKNASFGNVMISDGTNELLVYGMYDANGNRYDTFTDKPVVGDTITVSGVVMSYDSVKQIYNAVLKSFTKGEKPVDPPEVQEAIDATIAEVLALQVAANTTTTEIYRVTGKITYVQNTTRGDLYITDGTNSLLIYGVVDADGNAYSALETKPKAGDTITVSGVVKNYNSINEIISGLIENLEEGEPEELATSTIAQAKALANGSIAKVEAVVIATNSKGFLIKDSTGTMLVYMNYTAFSYVVGDKLTITGSVVTYNDQNQFDNKAEISKTGTETYTDPTALELDRDKFEDQFETPVVGTFVELTGKLVIDGTYYNIEVEESTKQAAVLYPNSSLSLGLYDGLQVKVKGYTCGLNSEGTMLNLVVVSAECLEEVKKEKLPQTYDFTCSAAKDTTLATGWSWTKVNSDGAYATGYQSFRKDGQGIQSPLFENENNIKVTITYYLNNKATTGNAACYLVVTAYTENGTKITSQTSANLNTTADVVKSKLQGTHDLEFTLSGTDIAYITVEFVKDGGGNIGFNKIKVEKVQ